jgi:hypothetical protein
MTDLDSRTVGGASGAPPPGWYPDAFGDTRWWDGAAWTGHVQGPVAVEPVPEPVVEVVALPVAAAPVIAPVIAPVVTSPEGPADEVYANSFDAVVAQRVEADAAEAAAAAVAAARDPEPDHPEVHLPPVVPTGHVTPSRAADLDGPRRVGSVVLLAVAAPLALWGAVSLLAVVLRGSDALSLLGTPLALVTLVGGGWVSFYAVLALQRGERAELPDPLVDLAEDVADADRRVHVLIGLAVVVVAVSYAVGPLVDEEPVAQQAAPIVAVAAPKGFTPVADEVAYRLKPATTKGCAKGSTCRTVEIVALVPCTDVSAVVVFRDRFGGGLGTALLSTDAPPVGKPVALKAQVRDTGATQASVASIRCGTV